MPILAAFLSSLFTTAFSYFALTQSAKWARILTVLVVVVGLYAAFYASMLAAVTAISMVAPPSLGIAMGWFWPSNGYSCLATIFTAKVLAAGLRFSLRQLRTVAGTA